VIWANEYDKKIWETYEKNHPNTLLDKRSITEIMAEEVPDCDGIIGGPPCQSWSEAGALRGLDDDRGKLFFNFIDIIEKKRPKFFVVENVSGILFDRNRKALSKILGMFEDCGYHLSYKLLNASDYRVPQDRERVFFIGYRNDIKKRFIFPKRVQNYEKITLYQAIGDLIGTALPAKEKNYTNGDKCLAPNHEYMIGGFSTMYMSRNRVRSWNEQSFTIQAGGRHAPLHPQSPKMIRKSKDVHVFSAGQESLYRRLSIRECARVQTFPDSFIFYYNNLSDGYKMVGNAVPVVLANHIAKYIICDIFYQELYNNYENNDEAICYQNEILFA